MSTIRKMATVTSAAAMLTISCFAQDQKPKLADDDKSQEIVIRKKGGSADKMTIVVDGDSVTVNGKPVEEFTSPDVTVLQRDVRGVYGASPRIRSFGGPNITIDGDDMSFWSPSTGNKAMLGVLTEKSDDGVKIKSVTKESGADKAGLKKDDVITKVGDDKVTSPSELVKAINKYKPNDKVDITYKRGGKEAKLKAVLGDNKSRLFSYNFDDKNFGNKNFNFQAPIPPPPPLDNFDFHFNRKPKIGLQIQDVEEGKGVTVKDVDAESPASKAGLKQGDVITQINGKDIEGVDELQEEVSDLNDGDTVKLTYKRDGKSETVDVKIPKKLKTMNL